MMPDLKNCVKDSNGDIWCYDSETKSVCKIILERPLGTTIPQEVLLKLLKVANDNEDV